MSSVRKAATLLSEGRFRIVRRQAPCIAGDRKGIRLSEVMPYSVGLFVPVVR